jgi:hypothetical protein
MIPYREWHEREAKLEQAEEDREKERRFVPPNDFTKPRKQEGKSMTFTVPEVTTQLQRFSLTDTAITAMRDAYMRLTIAGLNDVAGFKAVHSARMVVKDHRVQVEKVRKELKADALRYGQAVDGEARRITGLLEPIESHLAAEEKRIEDEKDRIKNAARLAAEAEARAKVEAEAMAIRAEQERLAAERAALEAEKRAMEAERAKIEAERRRLADIEAARLRQIEDARIATEAAERARVETEARIAREMAAKEAAVKAKAEAEETARLRAEAVRPDREKLLLIADAVNAIVVPGVSPEAEGAASRVRQLLVDASGKIRRIVGQMTTGE